jgi:hypothetical protein
MIRSIFIIIFFPILVFSQSFTRTLLKPNSLQFRNNIYVFGFVQDKNDVLFKLYRTSNDLQRIDSISNNLGKEKTDNFLEITADTLHGYLNFYFQKFNSKNLAMLVRYSDSLKLITKAENFESNKINSLTTFENETYTYKNSTYTIRTSEDSLGKQFYLTKYTVISDQKPFEYRLTWQYPLEKRNINTTHVFYADSEVVFIYVTILSGDRKGQWILKLNSKNGTIVKGIKLNANGDDRSYILNNFSYDPKEKELLLVGNVYTKIQLDIGTKNFAFTGLNKENTFFFIRIDAMNEVASRDQKTIPIAIIAPVVKSAGKPGPPPFYHVKIKELKKVSKTEYAAYCDVYKSASGSLLFLYEGGFSFDVTIEEMGIELNAGKIYNSIVPFPNLVNSDPKDINGKIELKDIPEFDKFLYKQPIVDVEKQFGTDDNKKPKWIICKSDIKTGINSFYNVFVGLKGIESKLLLQGSKYNNPAVYKIKNDKIILFNYNPETSVFTLSAANW